jgi:hypothetical protein
MSIKEIIEKSIWTFLIGTVITTIVITFTVLQFLHN